ncbi:MAG: hypothetical protein RL130_371 [Actinomycetota bacterium]
MALTRPLKLKAEVVRARQKNSNGETNAVKVWVDSGVFHLDSEFTYAIPENLDKQVDTGIRVVVPFGNRECEAIVLSRLQTSQVGSLKQISKVLSPIPVATGQSLQLIATVAKRWAAHPYDVIRSAIPPRVASVDKEFQSDISENAHHDRPTKKVARNYFQLPARNEPIQLIAEYLKKRDLTQGSILVIVPESRLLLRFAPFLPNAVILDSHLAKSERYRSYLKTLQGKNLLVIGTRGGVFAPLRDLSEIVIVHESSEHLYEIRTPGWNARDVAILRSSQSSASLTFFGYSPSSETARLIEIGWLKFNSSNTSVRVRDFSPRSGELLPQGIFSSIRTALKSGPVLFVSPRKGYSQAVLCLECKNVALCSCGGKLQQRSPSLDFECVLCQTKYPLWRCSWCQSQRSLLLGRGSERFAHEIGKAFPGHAIVQSSGDKILDSYLDSKGIVIATPGALPTAVNGYSAIVILECDRLFTEIDMRSAERAREIIFSTGGLLATGGELLLVISRNHAVLSAVASGKPSLITRKELRERKEIGFPPFSRVLTLDIDTSEATSLLRALKSAQESERLPKNTRILGPSQLSLGTSRFLLISPISDGESFISLIHEFQRRRSSSKKKLAQVRVDPYSLTS